MITGMKCIETSLAGIHVIDIDETKDERGFFARTWDPAVARDHKLVEKFDYTCISFNTEKGTLRGMHYQELPHGETKLVRCTRGAVFDAVIDLRPASKTFKQWYGTDLTAENHRALYIPEGCAHGFVTLEPNTEVLYAITGEYVATAASGVRYDDPAFNIQWPVKPTVLSDRDRTYPDFGS